jgi:hypothetical protein
MLEIAYEFGKISLKVASAALIDPDVFMMKIDFIVYLADRLIGGLEVACHKARDPVRDWIGYLA